MKCYRLVKTIYGTVEKLFSGEGSFLKPARWNELGYRTIYCSSELSTTVSEQAYNSLMLDINMYNEAIKVTGKNTPKHFIERISKVQFSLGEIQLAEPDKLLKINSDEQLQKHLVAANLPKRILADARKSGYKTNPPLWTRKLSSHLCDQGHQGFIVPSARTNSGDSVVLFEENIDKNKFKVTQIINLEISSVSYLGKNLKNGELAATDKVFYKSDLKQGEAPILIL